MHNIVKRAPPTLFMLGNKDKLLPVATGKAYQKKTQEVGSECELIIYIDKRHGFLTVGKVLRKRL
jgi:acetyl esterase/lipase